jgi:hypothetical protein
MIERKTTFMRLAGEQYSEARKIVGRVQDNVKAWQDGMYDRRPVSFRQVGGTIHAYHPDEIREMW